MLKRGIYRRVFMLEMSGPTLEMLRERREQLPVLRRLLDDGAACRLVGPLQPSFACSYASLLTGKNPGRTGIFDSYRFPAGGYDRIPYDSGSLRAEPFFVRLGREGRRVGLLNVPFLAPLPQVHGFAVSGDEGAGDEFASPPELLRTLREDGYRVPFGASYSPGRERAFHEHVMRVLAMRRRALLQAFREPSWDFGMLTLWLVGELLHAFWLFYDPRHPRHRPFAEVFHGKDPLLELLQAIDRLVGEILELAGPDALVLVAAAWGHRLERARLHLNAFLHREGFLCFNSSPASKIKHVAFRLGIAADTAERIVHRLNLYRFLHYKVSRGGRAKAAGATFLSHQDVDWTRTRAVAAGYLGQIYLNVRGRRPAGTVPVSGYAQARDDVRRRLEAIIDPATGERIVARVVTREEAYAGDAIDDAPDLLVDCREGYSAHSGFAGRGRIVGPSPPNQSSDHWHEGFLLAAGPGVRAGADEARLEDLAPTVLAALGVEVPSGYDGKPLPFLPSIGHLPR